MKMIPINPAPMNKPMTVALSQAWSFPDPNCSARRNMIDAGPKIANPMRSSSGITLRTSDNEKASFFVLSGILMNAKIAAATLPIGRLM